MCLIMEPDGRVKRDAKFSFVHMMVPYPSGTLF